VRLNCFQDEDDAEEPCASRVEAMDLCRQLERVVLEYGEGEDLALSMQLCRLRARLSRQEMACRKQTTLDQHFVRAT